MYFILPTTYSGNIKKGAISCNLNTNSRQCGSTYVYHLYDNARCYSTVLTSLQFKMKVRN